MTIQAAEVGLDKGRKHRSPKRLIGQETISPGNITPSKTMAVHGFPNQLKSNETAWIIDVLFASKGDLGNLFNYWKPWSITGSIHKVIFLPAENGGVLRFTHNLHKAVYIWQWKRGKHSKIWKQQIVETLGDLEVLFVLFLD